jgi:hypothetical protein
MTSHSLPRTTMRRAVPVTALAVSALAFAGCGGDDDAGRTASKATTAAKTAVANVANAPKATLADDVPAKSVAYVEATIRPNGEAKTAIEQLARLAGVDDPGAELLKSFDDDDLPNGKTFEKDVLPALGDHVAAFLLQAASDSAAKDPQGSVVAEVKDADALRSSLEPSLRKDSTETTIDGQKVYRDKESAATAWIGDDLLAVGTEEGVRATIAAAKGGTLDTNQRFTKALGQVQAPDPLGLAWVDLQQAPTLNGALIKAGEESSKEAKSSTLSDSELEKLSPALRQRLRSAQGGGSNPFATATLPATDATYAMALQLKPGRLSVAAGGTSTQDMTASAKAGADAVAALPGGSWLAFGGAAQGAVPAGATTDETLKQLEAAIGELPAGLKDALGKIQAVSGSVRGDSLIGAGGAIVLRTSDAASAKALLDGFGDAAKSKGVPVKSQAIDGAESGLVAQLPGLPLQLAAGVQGDRVAIGLGIDSIKNALKPASKLADDPIYGQAKQALGGLAPSLLIDPKPLTNLIGSLGVGEARQAVEALQRLKLVAAGQEATSATTWRGSLVVDYDAS